MTLKEIIRKRTAETRDLEERIREAESAEAELPGLREQLQRYLDRQAHFASFGDRHIEFEQSVTYRNHGVVELEPQRSKLSGKELAKTMQPKIDEIAGVIADKERLIAEPRHSRWSGR